MKATSNVWHRKLLPALASTLVAATILLGLAPEPGDAQPAALVDEDPNGIPYAAGELLVSYKPGASNEERGTVSRRASAETEEKFPEIDSRLLAFPEIKNENAREQREQALERQRQALERSPVVEAADYNYIVEPQWVPDDPRLGDQWALGKVNALRAWEYSRGRETDIAIVDSGIDQNHSDLGKIAGQYDFVENDSVADDDYGHGTHVAGIASSVTGNGKGGAGMSPYSRLLIAKILDSSGDGTISDVIKGIEWAVDNGAKVINLSLGHQGESTSERDAVNYAWSRGVVVVGAAGNNGGNVKLYPGAYKNAISVAATTRDDRRASFSNYGEWVDLAAPGVEILSTVPNGYDYKSGTSMATPYVAGLAALISAQGYSATQVRNRMESTAVDLGPKGKDVGFGYGRINAYRAAYRSYKQVVDNASSRFSASGGWYLSTWNQEKAGPNYRVTKPATRSGTAKFRVNVPSTTNYAVYAWWPDYPRFNSRTRYLIRTVGGWKAKMVDQRKNGGKFNYLGTYRLPYGDKNYIRVAGRSGKPGYIVADAVLIRRK